MRTQIVGLTMALGLDDGFSEPVFALAFVVSCIVRPRCAAAAGKRSSVSRAAAACVRAGDV
jgi:acid phosphatase family membrane protein YuiD